MYELPLSPSEAVPLLAATRNSGYATMKQPDFRRPEKHVPVPDSDDEESQIYWEPQVGDFPSFSSPVFHHCEYCLQNELAHDECGALSRRAYSAATATATATEVDRPYCTTPMSSMMAILEFFISLQMKLLAGLIPMLLVAVLYVFAHSIPESQPISGPKLS